MWDSIKMTRVRIVHCCHNEDQAFNGKGFISFCSSSQSPFSFSISLYPQVGSNGGQNEATGKSPHHWFMFAPVSRMYLPHFECNRKHRPSQKRKQKRQLSLWCGKPQLAYLAHKALPPPQPLLFFSLYLLCFITNDEVEAVLSISHANGNKIVLQKVHKRGGVGGKRLCFKLHNVDD